MKLSRASRKSRHSTLRKSSSKSPKSKSKSAIKTNDLISNFNTNFDKLLIGAFMGYLHYDELEKLLIQNIRNLKPTAKYSFNSLHSKSKKRTQSLNRFHKSLRGNRYSHDISKSRKSLPGKGKSYSHNTGKTHTDKLIEYFIQLAKVIRAGKEYFLNEINQMSLQHANLETKNKLITLLNQLNKKMKRPLTPNSKIEEVEVSGGGSSAFTLIIQIMVTLLISSYTSANTIQSYMPRDEVINLDIKMPEFASPFNTTYNPLSAHDKMQMTRMFTADILDETDAPKLTNTDLNVYFNEYAIQNRRTGLEGLMTQFLGENMAALNEEFKKELVVQVQQLNKAASSSNHALRETCKAFTGSTVPVLPLATHVFLNSQLYRDQEMMAQRDEVLADTRARLKMDEQLKISASGLPGEKGTVETIIDTVTPIATASVYDVYKWFTPTSKPNSTNVTISTEEAKQIKERIQKESEIELQKQKEEIDRVVFEKMIEKQAKLYNERRRTQLYYENLEKYLLSICEITPTRYNIINGTLYQKDIPSDRLHLVVLAQNVKTYYPDVIEGIYVRSVNGEYEISKQDKEKLDILLEKAEATIPLLVKYDIIVASALSGSRMENEKDVHTFFSNLKSMWKAATDEMTGIAESVRPMTQKEKERELKKKIEDAKSILKEQEVLHRLEKEQKQQEINMTSEMNDLDEEAQKEYDRENANAFSSLFSGTEQFANVLVNKTGNILNNGVENAGRVINTGATWVGDIWNNLLNAIFYKNMYFIISMVSFVSLVILSRASFFSIIFSSFKKLMPSRSAPKSITNSPQSGDKDKPEEEPEQRPRVNPLKHSSYKASQEKNLLDGIIIKKSKIDELDDMFGNMKL